MNYVSTGFPLCEGEFSIKRCALADVRGALMSGAASHIGHPATAQLMGAACNRAPIPDLLPGDEVYIVRLRTGRQAQVREVTDLTEADLEAFVVQAWDLAAVAKAAGALAASESHVWCGEGVEGIVLSRRP